MHHQRWYKHEPKNSTYTELPARRFGHSLNVYNDSFVLFGGCGNYSEKTKMHESFNDVRIFNIKQKEWEKVEYNLFGGLNKQFEPEKRMFHAAATM